MIAKKSQSAETHIGIRVSRDIAERIQRVADRTHRNKSQVVRMCVEQYIEKEEAALEASLLKPPQKKIVAVGS
jgi:predicted transcriptional regulator